MARYRRSIETIGPYAHGVPFVTNSGIAPDGNIQELLGTAVIEYGKLVDFAGDHGVRIALEPLNVAIINVETAIWTLEQGMRPVEQVYRPNFGICLDVWNVWQNPRIEDVIQESGQRGRTYVVQLSDWRTPRSFEDRAIPGQGSIPLPRLLRTIHESGYDGPYVVEIFSGDVPGSLWKGDLVQLIRDCRAGVDRAWSEAIAAAPSA
jgi:sugar phosphate isomerase/epimerase